MWANINIYVFRISLHSKADFSILYLYDVIFTLPQYVQVTNEILAVRLGEGGGAVRLKDRFLGAFLVKRIYLIIRDNEVETCYKNSSVLEQNPLKTYDNQHEEKIIMFGDN